MIGPFDTTKLFFPFARQKFTLLTFLPSLFQTHSNTTGIRPFLGIPNYHINLRKSGVGYLTKSELPKQLPSGFVIDSRRCQSYRKKLD